MSRIVSALGILLALLLVMLPFPESLVAIAGVGLVAIVAYSPLLSLLFWLLSTPVLSYWVEVNLGGGVPDITYDRVFVVAITIAMLFRQLIGLEAPFRFGATEAAMSVFLFVAGLSLVKSDDLPRDLQLLLDCYMIPFLLYWIARSLFTRTSISFLSLTMAALGVILVGLGTVQMLVGHVPFLPEGARRLHADRMTSTFINAAEFGGVVAMTGCACIAAAAFASSLAKRWLLLGAAAAHYIGVVLSLTRAVWVAAFAGLAVLAWKNSAARRVIGRSMLVAALMSVIALPIMLNTQMLAARAAEQAPIFNRIISIVTVLRMWIHKPLLGYGFGRYVYAESSREFLTPVGSIPAEWGAAVFVPHNEFLHTLVMMGAVGLACYLVVLWNAFRTASSWRRMDPEAGQWLGLALGAVLAIFVIDGMFADLIFFKFHGMLFFTLFGAAAGMLDRSTAAIPEHAEEGMVLASHPAAH